MMVVVESGHPPLWFSVRCGAMFVIAFAQSMGYSVFGLCVAFGSGVHWSGVSFVHALGCVALVTLRSGAPFVHAYSKVLSVKQRCASEFRL